MEGWKHQDKSRSELIVQLEKERNILKSSQVKHDDVSSFAVPYWAFVKYFKVTIGDKIFHKFSLETQLKQKLIAEVEKA